MSLKSEKVVVITGGAGFIGSNLADALLQQGERVVVLDNLSRPGTEKNLRWLVSRHPRRLQVEIGDVRDAEVVARVVKRAHTIYHLAAQVAVTSSLTDPEHDFAVNILGRSTCWKRRGRRRSRRWCSTRRPTRSTASCWRSGSP